MRYLFWDSETSLIAPAKQAPEMACLTYCWDNGQPEILHWTEAGRFLDDAFSDPGVAFGTANGAFDNLVAIANFPLLLPKVFAAYDANRVYDVQVRERLLDIAYGKYRWIKGDDGKWVQRTYDLAALARRHTDIRVDKKDPEIEYIRLSYGDFRHLPLSEWSEKRIAYAKDDAVMTQGVFYSQERVAAQHTNVDLLADQHRQTKTDLVRKLISAWGLRTDEPAVRALEMKTIAAYESLKEVLVRYGLVRPDGTRDTTKAKDRMLAVCGYRAETTKEGRSKSVKIFPVSVTPRKMQLTDSGDVSLSSEACLDSEDPILKMYGELGEEKSVLSKDVKMLLLGATFPIHTRYGMAESGRWTSSGPNVQNPRRMPGIREAFRPREGWVYAQADVEGLELCTLAQACIDLVKYSKLADAINAGMDVHLDLAASILGVTYEEAVRRKKLGKTLHVQAALSLENSLAREPLRHEVQITDEQWQDYQHYIKVVDARQASKVANFGFPGGLGIESMIDFAKSTYGVILTEERCRWLKDLWLSKWPEMNDYFAYIGNLTQMGEGDVMQLRSGRIRGGVSFCAAANTYFQGLGADAVSASGWQLAKECYLQSERSVLFGSRIVNMIHDEWFLEVRDNYEAHDKACRLERVMVDHIQPWTPDVKISAPPTLARYWSKSAVEVRDNDGRLIPWS